jgi:hypothetical protein
MSKPCKSCASCAMPLERPEDFSQGNTQSEYCRYCTDETGNLLPYEAVLKMNAGFYIESQGISPEAAMKMAEDLLKSQPAWA